MQLLINLLINVALYNKLFKQGKLGR